VIAFLEGKLVQLNPTYAIIQQGGIAFQVHITLNTFSAVQHLKECRLYTHLHVRKDLQAVAGFDLYGFVDEQEKLMFEKLLSVSGIGANTARMMLSTYKAADIASAIARSDVNFLKRIKGIGQKTAERAVLELKDKLGSGFSTAHALEVPQQQEALGALVMLGFNRLAAEKAVSQINTQQAGVLTVEEIIKQALKQL
jgi:Holliday junction DNA helicase RuvA